MIAVADDKNELILVSRKSVLLAVISYLLSSCFTPIFQRVLLGEGQAISSSQTEQY